MSETSREMTRIAVSIINYRTAQLTIKCLQAVLTDLEGCNGRVVVVDNASGDGSIEEIEAWLAQQVSSVPVDIICSPTNRGFSGGHNLGIESCAAEFYMLLNSDAVVRPGFFDAILTAARAHPVAGLFAPRLEYEDGTVQDSCFRFATPVSEFIRGACTGAVTRLLKRHDVSLGPHPDPASIEWASFACIVLRGDMVQAVGPMDEGYFLYFEDADYCLEARRLGWGICYVPEARVIHYRGGSGPVKALARLRKRMPAYYYASRSRFFYKAYGRTGLIAANLSWYAGRGVAQMRRILGKTVNPMTEAEARDIWINVSSPLGPRYAPGE